MRRARARSLFPGAIRCARGVFVFTAFTALLTTLAVTLDGNTGKNVIFILADDMGYGDVAYNGHPYAITPNLDTMASHGIRVDNFYVNSSICSPSRIAFVTGRYPGRQTAHDSITTDPSKVADDASKGLVPLLPHQANYMQAFKTEGYTVGHFGKWHMSVQPYGARRQSYGLDFARFLGKSANAYDWTTEDHKQRSSKNITDDVIEWLEAYDHETGPPFFLNVWLFQPHTPVEAHPNDRLPYDGIAFDSGDFDSTWEASYYGWIAENFPEGDLNEALQRYLSVITLIDSQVGRIRNALSDLGIANQTYLVFTSDNGPETVLLERTSNPGAGSTGGFRGRKRSLYEGGVRVPFVIAGPGLAPRHDETTVMSGVDFWPTIASLAGIGSPSGIDGRDVSDAIRGLSPQVPLPLFWHSRTGHIGFEAYDTPELGIRLERWKMYMDEDGQERELYDLWADPKETNNLAAAHPTVAADLAAIMEEELQTMPPVEPAIFWQTPSDSVPSGRTFKIETYATGLATPQPLSFQWYKDGIEIPDETTHMLDLGTLSADDTGSYMVEVTNAYGTTQGTTDLNASVFAAWQLEYWGPDLENLPSDAAPDADPDGDQVLNLTEFGFLGNPLVPNGLLAPSLTADPNSGTLTAAYLRRYDPHGLKFTCQTSLDLKTWTPAEDAIERVTLQDGDSQTVEVVLPLDLSLKAQFVRFRVEQEELVD